MEKQLDAMDIMTPKMAAKADAKQLVEKVIYHYKQAVQEERVFRSVPWKFHTLSEFYTLIPELRHGFEEHVMAQIKMILAMPIKDAAEACAGVENITVRDGLGRPLPRMERELRWVVNQQDKGTLIALATSTQDEVEISAANQFTRMYVVLRSWTRNTALLNQVLDTMPEIDKGQLSAAYATHHAEMDRNGTNPSITRFGMMVRRAFEKADPDRLVSLMRRFSDFANQEEDEAEERHDYGGMDGH